MRVALIVGVLLILLANGVAFATATEPFRPYLADASLALSVLVLIGLLLAARQKSPPPQPAAEPGRPVPPTRAAPPAVPPPPTPAAARADAESSVFSRSSRNRAVWSIS